MPRHLPLVLLIEDDPDTREMYALALRQSGFDVAEAANAESAIEQLHTVIPAAIVCDIVLPGADGFDLGQHIRQRAALRTTPLIGITALPLVQALTRARHAGFDDVLIKPCPPAELIDTIERLLNPDADTAPRPVPAKAAIKDKKTETPSERAWRIRNRRFGGS